MVTLFVADMNDTEDKAIQFRIQEKISPSDLRIIDYKMARYAVVQLPSGTEIMISIGATMVKFLKKGFLGYVMPKTILSKEIADWDNRFLSHSAILREGAKLNLLTGLIIKISGVKSEDEISQAIEHGNAIGEGMQFHMLSR